jgi:phosphoribosylamine-glycine ligase
MKISNIDAVILHKAVQAVTAEVDMPYEGRLTCALALRELEPVVLAFNAERQAIVRRSGLPAHGQQFVRADNPAAFDAMEAGLVALDAKQVTIKVQKMTRADFGKPKLDTTALAALLGLVQD